MIDCERVPLLLGRGASFVSIKTRQPSGSLPNSKAFAQNQVMAFQKCLVAALRMFTDLTDIYGST